VQVPFWHAEITNEYRSTALSQINYLILTAPEVSNQRFKFVEVFAILKVVINRGHKTFAENSLWYPPIPINESSHEFHLINRFALNVLAVRANEPHHPLYSRQCEFHISPPSRGGCVFGAWLAPAALVARTRASGGLMVFSASVVYEVCSNPVVSSVGPRHSSGSWALLYPP
jgi:hypothetical protein